MYSIWKWSVKQFKHPDSPPPFLLLTNKNWKKHTEEIWRPFISVSDWTSYKMTLLLMGSGHHVNVNIPLLPALCQQITKYVAAWACVWIQSVTYFGAGRGHNATTASCSSSWFWVSRNWLFIPQPPRVGFIQDLQSSGTRSLQQTN